MTSFWSKLNQNLSTLYQLYREEHHGETSVRVPVTMFYDGDLAALEVLGFKTSYSSLRRAVGFVDLEVLEQLAAHPGTVHLELESVPKPLLANSVNAIKVKGNIWSLKDGKFTGKTGKGVLIGVIDTGIDFTHDVFHEMPDATPPKTRIFRIWDQLLGPAAGEKSPDVKLLEPANRQEVLKTYGVEYKKDEQIDPALAEENPRRLIRHHDRDGHGTAVAGVAAGNGGNGRGNGGFVGVAPEAQLIVVNVGEPRDEILNPDTPASFYDRTRHAVNYILKVAEAEKKSVVINMSLGDQTEPHDGRSSQELFLSERFAGAKGYALVVGAGNTGTDTFRRTPDSAAEAANLHGMILIPAGKTVRLDVELYQKIRMEKSRRSAAVDIYYPVTKTLSEAIVRRREPDPEPVWEEVGPALNADVRFAKYKNWQVTFRHATERSVTPSGQIIERCNAFNFRVHQNAMDGMPEGPFEIELTFEDTASAHVFCSDFRPPEVGVGFRIRGADPADYADIDDHYQIGTPGGAANIFTVASVDQYRAQHVADHSSRGPIAQYGGPPPPPKPDLAAPGQGVNTAHSSEKGKAIPGKKRVQFEQSGFDVQVGTSIAAPHVAGLIALLFECKSDLTYDQLKTVLKPDKPPRPPLPHEIGVGPIDGDNAVKKVNSL